MASLGGGRLNPNPCTPEDNNANWQYLANNVINDIYQTISTIVAGSSDHKVSVNAADEALTGGRDGPTYLLDAIANNDSFTAGDVTVYVQEGTSGDLGKAQFFVKQADIGGGGSSDHKVSVNAADEAMTGGRDGASYLLDAIANNDSFTAGDVTVYVEEGSSGDIGKANFFVKQADVAGAGASTPRLLGTADADIAARSGATPGPGTATVIYADGLTGASTLENWSTKLIPISTYVVAIQIGGHNIIVDAFC